MGGLHDGFGGVCQDIRALRAELAKQTRQIVFAMTGGVFTTMLLTYTAARFG